jgi:cyclopropane fatty-acyl-phospholipid synthase-like methyltransferase
MVRASDRQFALEQYRKRAGAYDLELAAFEPIRRMAIERLQLTPGDTVLDVGCGTGLSFWPAATRHWVRWTHCRY